MAEITLYELDERKHPAIAKEFPESKYFNWISGEKFKEKEDIIIHYNSLQKYRKLRTFKIYVKKIDGKKEIIYDRKKVLSEYEEY